MARLPAHMQGTSTGEAKLSRAVLAHHQRERVLANVIPVFAKRGYQATTVDDLLAAGKVGVGNFYSLFEGKEDCFLAAFNWVLGGARRRIDASYEDATSWAEGAVLGLRELIVLVCAEPVSARVVLIEAQAAGPNATACYEALLDEVTARLRSARRRGVTRVELPERFEEASVAGLAYYLQQCLLGADAPDPGPLLSEVAPLVLEPIVGLPELRRLLAAHPVA